MYKFCYKIIRNASAHIYIYIYIYIYISDFLRHSHSYIIAKKDAENLKKYIWLDSSIICFILYYYFLLSFL
jgi:hypothetical protein